MVMTNDWSKKLCKAIQKLTLFEKTIFVKGKSYQDLRQKRSQIKDRICIRKAPLLLCRENGNKSEDGTDEELTGERKKILSEENISAMKLQ